MKHLFVGVFVLLLMYTKSRMANEPQNYWQPEPSDQPDGTQPGVPQDAPVQNYQTEPGIEDESYQNQEPTPLAQEDTPDNPPITWTAQEYVHIDKGPWWYIFFVIVVLGLIALDIFVLKSWTLSVLVVVMAVALIVYIRRPPRVLTYALSPNQGLYVGEQLYGFDQFKAFGLIRDDGHDSIMLIPRKRFAPGVSVFFPEEAGERIVDILGQRLPMETLKLDLVDVLVRKMRL